MKKLSVIIVVVIAGVFGGIKSGIIPSEGIVATSNSSSDQELDTLFKNHKSNVQIQGYGKVVRLLSDDNEGSRHQKFIIQLKSGQTLLVAHNIDLADRVKSLKAGDLIEFNGEYEWNSQGGIIHWTHHDPHGNHMSGWLKHNGQTYQ